MELSKRRKLGVGASCHETNDQAEGKTNQLNQIVKFHKIPNVIRRMAEWALS